MDLRDDRLGDGLDSVHQLGAHAKEMANTLQVLVEHFCKVVPRAEHPSLRGQNDARDITATRMVEGCVEFLHQCQGHHVEPLGLIEPNGDGVPLSLAQNIAIVMCHISNLPASKE